MSRTAVIAGATGLVGSHLLRRLTAEPAYSRLIVLVRKPTGLHDSKIEERVLEFTQLRRQEFPPGSDVFCALGTTIRQAGSKQAFQAVDLDLPVALARRAVEMDAKQFLVVSSVGANASTSNFYLSTKASMEKAVSTLGLRAVHIFRPSFLLGARNGARPAENAGIAIARAVAFALIGRLRKYRAIEADQVAAAMIRAALQDTHGVHIHHYDDMRFG